MAISKDEVKRIADLARIELTAAEIEQYQVELSGILDYIDQLNELDTTDVPPTAQVTGLENQMRPDVVNYEFKRDDMLASAIETAEGHVKVKSVFNKKT